MLIEVLKSKIHRGTVTDANLNYVGSITIDSKLMEAASIIPGEKVQVVNVNNGARIETYTIAGEWGTGVICLNGAAARHFLKGDPVIIIAYGYVTVEEGKALVPKIVIPDEQNMIE
ncbi:MAG: aspartate 1-decarboxylase [Porphyromonas sp.]|nr:aspartate 1-decarboxylase [Porphyromonas sp.]